MMAGLGWQDAAVVLIALGALGYLVRRRLKRKSPGCDTCPRSAVTMGEVARPKADLISIDHSPPSEGR